MKSLSIITIGVIILVITSCTQTKAPTEVIDAFNEMFPEAQSVEWTQEDENEWEVEFVLNENEISAEFDTQGVWIETEVEIDKDEVPQLVLDIIDTTYVDYKIEEIESVKMPNFVGYEFELEKEMDGEEVELEVYIDNAGNIFKVEEEGDDDSEHEHNHDHDHDHDHDHE